MKSGTTIRVNSADLGARRRARSRQPLKQSSPWVMRIGMGILFSGLFAVIIFHHASISHYINRPITQVELS
ncbi:MAG: hypothetical protein RLN96_11465, partial [Pseudomonadales bacterium]